MSPTFIDLFSGCGGFSLGMKWAGLQELAALDFNPEAVAVFKANFPEMKDRILEKDLMEYKPDQLAKRIGLNRVDVIIGGPPCQGFSTVRQRDGSNSGERIIHDDRRELYQRFLDYVGYFQPKIFVMENVLGIRSAAGGHFFNRVQFEARKLGYRVHGEVIKAWEYGVPQKRERQLIIGTRLDLPLFSCRLYMPSTHGNSPSDGEQKMVSLGEAIGDLPPLKAGEGIEVSEYNLNLRKRHIKKYGGRYIVDILGVDKTPKLTAHCARMHNERDLRDFAILGEGETSAHAMARGIKMEFPYDKETFKDRYTKQHRDGLCSTIVAHLSKDGLMFIHPTQNRSLTPREAARIQSFPDWFEFPVVRTHQYRIIGNAVPPLVGKAVGLAISRWLKYVEEFSKYRILAPTITGQQSIQWLLETMATGGNGNLAKLSDEGFKHGWFAIAYLYNHLHPDSAKEHGTSIVQSEIPLASLLHKLPQKLIDPIYERSGWPIALAPIAAEAHRRFEDGQLLAKDYYCSEIFIQGYYSERNKSNVKYYDS